MRVRWAIPAGVACIAVLGSAWWLFDYSRSYTQVSLPNSAFDDALQGGRRLGEPWTKEPGGVSRALARALVGPDVGTTACANEDVQVRAQARQEAVVIVTTDQCRDDSIKAFQFLIEVEREGEYWRPKRARVRYRCWRNLLWEGWQTSACP